MPVNGFNHLPLPLLYQGKPKLRGFGTNSEQTKNNIANRGTHGGYVKRRATELSRFWRERRSERDNNKLPEIKSGIPILLEIDPSSDIDFLRGLGFEIVCEIEEGFIIVASEDVDLTVLNRKTDEFINQLNKRCNTPARVYALCEDNDRLQRVLSRELYAKWHDILPDNTYIIDIGVSCCGNIKLPNRPTKKDKESDEQYIKREKNWNEKFNTAYMEWDNLKMERETIIENFISDYSGEIVHLIDDSNGIASLPDSFSARLKVSGKCLVDLVLNFAYIFEVSEAEEIIMTVASPNVKPLDEKVNINAPHPQYPVVCVIDSGIQEEHKYLSPAIIKENSISLIPNDDNVSDEVVNGGHGTRVAGAVLYPNSVPREGSYQLPCWLYNMRVLGKDNCMPQEIYPPKIITNAIEKVLFR